MKGISRLGLGFLLLFTFSLGIGDKQGKPGVSQVFHDQGAQEKIRAATLSDEVPAVIPEILPVLANPKITDKENKFKHALPKVNPTGIFWTFCFTESHWQDYLSSLTTSRLSSSEI